MRVGKTGNAVALVGSGELLAAALTSKKGLRASPLDMEKGRIVLRCTGDPSTANRVFLTLFFSCSIIVKTVY